MASPVAFAAPILVLNPDDNVGVALTLAPEGFAFRVGNHSGRTRTSIRPGHKLALTPIATGGVVRKYGEVIGFATEMIEAGSWVHSHNMALADFHRDYASATQIPSPPAPLEGRTFQGFRRPSGKSGTRNYVALISTVNCSATVCKQVARLANAQLVPNFPGVDGVIALTHAGGCGMPFSGLQHEILNRVLAGMAKHPNVGAYLLMGLGCEQGSLGYLVESQGLMQLGGQRAAKLPHVMSLQDQGGTTKTIAAALDLLQRELLPAASLAERTSIPASELILATKCGGSDGNSGITANPALGFAVDMLVAAGGTALLGETTEIFGAEHLLTRRARSTEIAQKLIDRIEWWKWYASVFNASIDGNPSVGNKEGGLTTIAEKSLGAIAKGGSTALERVYLYAEEVGAKGLVVMDSPGFDPVCLTGMVAGGANVAVFTTGRGSCFGCKPTPSIKVSTHSQLYERMPDDMDLDAGGILKGRSVEEVGREIFEEILAVASGRRTKSERLGYGDEEFAPWMIGPTL